MPERYRPSRFSPLRRRELEGYARCGCETSAVMLECNVEFTEAVDILDARRGRPPHAPRRPATVIDLAEVRRLIAEAETGEGQP